MHSFDAIYDEFKVAHAERSFYLRSLLEFRRAMTLGPPIFFAAAVILGIAFKVSAWFVGFFSVFLILSITGPIIFYIARPLAAQKLAREYPIRHVQLTDRAIEMTFGKKTATIEWSRIEHLWEESDYFILVLGNSSLSVSHATACLQRLPSSFATPSRMRPNPSLKRSANGKPPGPGWW